LPGARRRGFLHRPNLEADWLGAPQFFEPVIGPDRRLHDVHHRVAQIDQYPLAAFLALDRHYMAARCLHLVANVRGERPCLSVRGGGGYDHAIEEFRLSDGVEDLDVLGLDVIECVDDNPLQLSQIHEQCLYQGWPRAGRYSWWWSI
jgi:hypothetical protein